MQKVRQRSQESLVCLMNKCVLCSLPLVAAARTWTGSKACMCPLSTWTCAKTRMVLRCINLFEWALNYLQLSTSSKRVMADLDQTSAQQLELRFSMNVEKNVAFAEMTLIYCRAYFRKVEELPSKLPTVSKFYESCWKNERPFSKKKPNPYFLRWNNNLRCWRLSWSDLIRRYLLRTNQESRRTP